MNETEDTFFPEPDLDEPGKAFWDALQENRLTYQRCGKCNHAWLPARRECPNCLDDKIQREDSKGFGKLVSWVVYHHAYQPAFARRLPYVVAIIQLNEGPRMISNIINDDPMKLKIDQGLKLIIEKEGDRSIPRFTSVQKNL